MFHNTVAEEREEAAEFDPSSTKDVPLTNTLDQNKTNSQNTTNEASETTRVQLECTSPDRQPIPDGGYGWLVVFACFVHTFWLNAWTGSWGILQVALLKTTLSHSSASTVSFIGSLGISMGPALSVVAIRIARLIGARWASLIGILFYGIGNIVSAQAVTNVGGLFVASGVTYGLSSGLMYTMCNTLPVQWFESKLGTANGIIKLGGGIGATVMAVVTSILTDRVGIAWTFRILGFASLATGVPVAFMIKERAPLNQSYNIDYSLFRNGPFSCLFVSGAIGVFAIYAPSFFLPYITSALGFSQATSTAAIACFNACMAIGRLISGIACDRFGTMAMLLLTMALNTVTFFALWSVSSTLAVSLIFAVLNGIANGAFFVTMPTAVARVLGEQRATGGISLAITGWFPGLLVGTPIAGYLIDATGADKATSIGPFRPAVFYAGGTAFLAFGFVVIAHVLTKNLNISKL